MGEWPGSVDVNIDNLPTGTYQLVFTGTGYCSYTQTVELKDYSKHVTVGTGDATFTLGDVNDDGKVDAKDRDLMTQNLGKTEDLSTYDLNGDGEISVIDLSYVTRSIGVTGEAEVKDTALLNPVDITQVNSDLMGHIKSGDNLENLFKHNGTTVSLEPNGLSEEVVIPIEWSKSVE